MRRPRDMYAVRGTDGLDDILAKLRGGPLAVDTETTELSWRTGMVGSINLAAQGCAVFAYKGALAPVARFLSDEVKKKRELVFHEAKFDMHHLRASFGLHIPYPVHDTKVESYMLDQRGVGNWGHSNHHLKDLAKAFVDPDARDHEKELMASIKANGGTSKGDWLLAHSRYYTKYGALDPWYTLQLHLQFIERIKGWSQPDGYPSLMSLYRTEQWMTLALRDMEERGVRVNRGYLEQWRDELGKQLAAARKRLVKLARKDINWNSTPQLRHLLYEEMELTTDRLNDKKTEYSTDKIAMLRLAHPIGAEILAYRKLKHAHGTDATGMLNAITSENIIHCNYNQNVETGRLSCTEPNLQGQDRKSGVRMAFIPRRRVQLRFADYSQMEMRFAAHYAKEPYLIKSFNENEDFDIHMATAIRMYGTKHPTDNQRKRSKDMNFASIYGAGEDKQTEMAVDSMTVAEAYASCLELGYKPKRTESPHRALVRKLRERYKKVFPTIPLAARHEEEVAKVHGFAMSAFGRHRYLDRDDSYKAFNSKIQGSAANMAKRGMVAVYKELQLGTGELALLLQVHDEIIYESEGNKRTDRHVLELLADTTHFSVPIIADMKGSTKNWQEKEKIVL